MGTTSDRNDPRLTHGADSAPTGQAEAYLVMSEAERAKGFVQPVRRTYVHDTCGRATTISQDIAETYARDPQFYGATYCVGCRMHLPVAEFKWDDGVRVGSTSIEEPRAEFPHCNSEVLHAPGTCQYCDLYPDRQAMRAASNTPFTPAEANGWHGNVAQPRDDSFANRLLRTSPPCPDVIYRDEQPSFRQRLRNAIGLR